MSRAFTPEQLLLLADEFSAHLSAPTPTQIRSFTALAACAAVPGARIHGVPVCGSDREAADELAQAIVTLRPLTAANAEFARLARDVYLRWADTA